MLIEPMPDTFRVLTVDFDGVTYSVEPHEERAYVPSALGMALARAGLARVIDAEAEPGGEAWLDGSSKYSAWVVPNFPTTH
jgi:hypothetical protein